jgi:hypothetical protein
MDFYDATAATLADDATGQPCVGCGTASPTVSTWIPTLECMRDDWGIHDDRGTTIVYPFCPKCAKKASHNLGFCSKIEARLIETLKHHPLARTC